MGPLWLIIDVVNKDHHNEEKLGKREVGSTMTNHDHYIYIYLKRPLDSAFNIDILDLQFLKHG